MGYTFPQNRHTASTIRLYLRTILALLLFQSAREDWKLHSSVSLHSTAEGMKRALSSHDFFKMHQCIQEKVLFLCGFTKMRWCTRGKVLSLCGSSTMHRCIQEKPLLCGFSKTHWCTKRLCSKSYPNGSVLLPRVVSRDSTD